MVSKEVKRRSDEKSGEVWEMSSARDEPVLLHNCRNQPPSTHP